MYTKYTIVSLRASTILSHVSVHGVLTQQDIIYQTTQQDDLIIHFHLRITVQNFDNPETKNKNVKYPEFRIYPEVFNPCTMLKS